MAALNQKGQAAVTDALFFLIIVTTLATLIFLFSNTYGNTVTSQIDRMYGAEYTTSALKTILYSSVPRNPEEELDKAEEVDYLLAMVKEDFANQVSSTSDAAAALGDATKTILKNNVLAIMEPIASQFDYLFYIWRRDNGAFVYFLFHKSEETGHVDYFCNPPSMSKLDGLFVYLPNTAQSTSSISLQRAADPNDPLGSLRINARADLVIWPAVQITNEVFSELRCTEAK